MALSKRPFGLEEHFVTITRHFGKIVTITILSLAVATVGSFLVSKTYVASSRILIQTNREHLKVSAQLTPGEGSATLNERDVVITESEIFKSPLLVERLVESLGTDVVLEGMTWRWDWLKELPSKWIGNIIDWAAEVDLFRPLLELVGLEGGSGAAGATDAWAAGQKIAENIDVIPVRKADVFEVAFQAPSPEIAALITNKMVDIYLDHHVSVRRSGVTQEFFQVETERLQKQLEEADKEFQELKDEFAIVDIDVQKQMLLQRISEAESAFKNSELEAKETEKKIAELTRQLSQQNKSVQISSVAKSNPVVEQLQSRLTQLKIERDQYVPGSPGAVQIDEQMNTIAAQIASQNTKVNDTQTTSVSAMYQELQKTIGLEQSNLERLTTRGDIAERAQQYRDELALLDQQDAKYRSLKRKVEINEAALTQYLRKQEESRLNAVLDTKGVSNAVRIERATPPVRPVKPRKKRNILIGLLAGVLGGVGLAYLSEFLRRTVVSRRELEFQLNKPVLASVSKVKAIFKSKKKKEKKDELEYLNLYSELYKASKEGEPVVFFFTSTLEKEGKTVVCNKVATTIGNQGQSVLIVKIPNLNSKLARRFDRSDEIDESSLPGVGKTDHENVLLAQLNTEITYLEADRVVALYRQKYAHVFDYILVDGPALGAYPAARCLTKSSDTVIYVVESDFATTEEINEVVESIESQDANVLGFVLRAD